MRLGLVGLSLVLSAVSVLGATPEGLHDSAFPSFRVETAEVHISFSVFDKRQKPVTAIQLSDFIVYRDGQPLAQKLQLERRNDASFAATVLTDVSASMEKAVPMAREAWSWATNNLLQAEDRVTYFDFGNELSPSTPKSPSRLTSLYDCLWKLIPQVSTVPNGQRSLIVFTDGIDNNSTHAVEDVIRLAVAQNVAIYAITTWKYKINYDEQVLDSLTSGTGGRLFVVKDSREMTKALQEIAQELRNGFELVFPADRISTGLHRISMQPTNRRLHFYHRAAYYQPAPNSGGGPLIASGR